MTQNYFIQPQKVLTKILLSTLSAILKLHEINYIYKNSIKTAQKVFNYLFNIQKFTSGYQQLYV